MEMVIIHKENSRNYSLAGNAEMISPPHVEISLQKIPIILQKYI